MHHLPESTVVNGWQWARRNSFRSFVCDDKIKQRVIILFNIEFPSRDSELWLKFSSWYAVSDFVSLLLESFRNGSAIRLTRETIKPAIPPRTNVRLCIRDLLALLKCERDPTLLSVSPSNLTASKKAAR